ncbi:MAG: DUF4956 domain-containing protein [Bacilli bacterium]|nr:DUF4956 domain-containing protein [Bacilli bacterium]
MGSLFDYLASLEKPLICLILIAATFLIALGYTLLASIKMRATKGFFLTSALMPMVVASVISMVSIFLDDSASGAVRIATIAVALGLIRFRSAPGKAEEMVLLFGGIAIGLIAGLGYLLVALIVALALAGLYVALSSTNLFHSKRFGEEKLLKVTIPEDLEYEEALNPILQAHLKSYELVEVKTTGMGSLFRLSYKVRLLALGGEKGLIDALRVKNSNLEVSLLPYVESAQSL